MGHNDRLRQAQELLTEVVQMAAAFKGLGRSDLRSVQEKITLPVRVQSAPAAGFLR